MITTGKNFGHYEIREKLGAGGMGEVFLAEDTKLGRKVAIKFLNEEFARDADKLRRFVQEAKAASALNHPNILTVYEIGETDGKNYIATEFIEGKTLREQSSGKESLQMSSVLNFAIQIAEALAAAHRAGIVHRDIKPENIMVRADDYVKVLDFGLAKLTETKAAGGEEDQTLVCSNPGMILGTVGYMSPEQARGQAVDARTDIWSFGVLLYEMLARRAPFAGETATDVMLSIVQKEPPALQHIAPDLPNELYFIVGKTLRKKADERYQSIGDVLTDLRRIKQRLDYEEIEKTLSPEASKARMPSQEHQTAIFNQQPKQSSDSGEAISTISTTSSGEKLPPNNLSA